MKPYRKTCVLSPRFARCSPPFGQKDLWGPNSKNIFTPSLSLPQYPVIFMLPRSMRKTASSCSPPSNCCRLPATVPVLQHLLLHEYAQGVRPSTRRKAFPNWEKMPTVRSASAGSRAAIQKMDQPYPIPRTAGEHCPLLHLPQRFHTELPELGEQYARIFIQSPARDTTPVLEDFRRRHENLLAFSHPENNVTVRDCLCLENNFAVFVSKTHPMKRTKLLTTAPPCAYSCSLAPTSRRLHQRWKRMQRTPPYPGRTPPKRRIPGHHHGLQRLPFAQAMGKGAEIILRADAVRLSTSQPFPAVDASHLRKDGLCSVPT